MKNLKTSAYIAVIVLAILAFGWVVWSLASHFFSLNAQVDQNTQDIQSIVQYINNQKMPESPTTPPTQ